jgi:predicted nuclease with TOPRIM domain
MIGPWNKIGFRQIAFGGGGSGGGTNTPLETTISNQPHALAYITPSEEGLLRSLGGTGQAGPGGVPAFPPVKGKTRGKSNKGTGFSGNYKEPKAPVAKSTPAPKEKSTPSYDFSSSNDDNDPAPVVYTPPPVAATPAPVAVTPAVKESTPGTPAKSIPEGFKPPDGPATSALQTWTNMDTGETWTANTGGWTAPNANWTTNPDKWTENKAKTDMEAKQSLFGTMKDNSSKYIDELKKGFTGAVTMGERDGPSLGGAQFTNEFRDYAKSMGYEIDKGMSPMDGPSFLVRPEGWTPDAFNAHIKTQEETAATAAAAAAAEAEAARQVKIKELEDQLSASQGLYGELQDKYGKTQEEYTGLKSNFEELFGNYGTLTGTYDEQKAAYDDLYGQYDTLESRLGDYNTQLADQKTNYESLMGQYSDLTGQYEDTTSLYDTLQSDFSGLQGTLAEQQSAYEAQKAAAEKNRVLGIAEKATSGAARPDPRYTQPAQTATPAYTPVAANQGAQSLTPGATPYGIAPIDYAANMPDFMNNPVNLNVPSFGATGQNAPPPIGGPMQQVTPMMDYSAPFQPYLQSINQQYGVNIPSAYTGIMAGGRQ